MHLSDLVPEPNLPPPYIYDLYLSNTRTAVLNITTRTERDTSGHKGVKNTKYLVFSCNYILGFIRTRIVCIYIS